MHSGENMTEEFKEVVCPKCHSSRILQKAQGGCLCYKCGNEFKYDEKKAEEAKSANALAEFLLSHIR